MRPDEVLDWEDFLKTNGCTGVVDYGDWIMCNCIFHEQSDTKRPSFGIHKETGDGNCFGCGHKDWEEICEEFGIVAEDFIEGCRSNVWEMFKRKLLKKNEKQKYKRFKLPEGTMYPFYNLEALSYFEKRNIGREVVSRFNVAYCYNNHSRYHQHILFPIFDEKGILYFNARYVGPNEGLARWRNPTDSAKWKTFFGWEMFKDRKSVWLVEGATDALKTIQNGFPTIAAKDFSPHQVTMLLKSGVENFFLFYDNDEAGMNFRRKARFLLGNAGKSVFDIWYPENTKAKDPGEFDDISGLVERNPVIREYSETFLADSL